MILPFATYKPVARIDDGPRNLRKAVVLHTCVCGVDLYNYWSGGAPAGVGSHFQVMRDGTIYQYLDTDRMTGHAYDANPWTVGIETDDGGQPAITPWTPQQVQSIVRICQALGVPGQLLAPGPSDGVGYHQLYSQWNHDAHDCPGPARRQQVAGIIDQLKGVPDVPPTLADIAKLFGLTEGALAAAIQSGAGLSDAAAGRQDEPSNAARKAAVDYLKGLGGGGGGPVPAHTHTVTGTAK